MTELTSESDVFVRRSHLNLAIALVSIFILSGLAFALLMWPGSAVASHVGRATALLPIGLAIAVGVILRPTSVKGFSLSGPGMKAILQDELRQFSLSRAYRNGFFAILVLQPLLAVLLTHQTSLNAVPLMGSVSVAVGAMVVLASVLWYDR